jgi:uncharacterized membrane protein
MSQPPGYPGSADPSGANQPPGYPPPPSYPPPGGYGTPPQAPGWGSPGTQPPAGPGPSYGAPAQPPGYGTAGTPGPPPGYGAPGYGTPGYGTPSPPPPGYGTPGYGSPAAGYPPQPGYGGPPTQEFSVGDAFRWAWDKFSKNALALIVSYVIYRVALGSLNFLSRLVTGALDQAANTTTTQAGETTSGAPALAIASAVIGLILAVVSFVVEAYTWTALITGCLDIADGRPVTIGSFFKPRNFGPAILAALLVGVLATVGLILLIIPGLVFLFFAALTMYFVIDRSLGPVDAMKASIATVRSNIGAVMMALLVTIGTTIAGIAACCVGLIVAVPLNTLIWVYTYRKLSGGQVVGIEQPMYYPPGPPAGMPPPGPQYY